MKIVIVGGGEVGESLCHFFSEGEHDVTLIEQTEAVAASIDQSYNARVLVGNGRCARQLLEGGVDECDFLMAMTHDDPTNLLACAVGRSLGARQTIARIHDQTYVDHTHFNYQVHFGIDLLITPEALCAVEIAKKIRNPGRVEVEHFARGQIEAQNVLVSDHSKLLGRPLGDLKIDGRVRIVYLHRGDFQEVPNRNTILKAGDILTLMGPSDYVCEFRDLLAQEWASESANVIIFGATEAAIALIRMLGTRRYRIKVIDEDPNVCRAFAQRFSQVTVINGDPQDSDLLQESGVADCDHFVACSRVDEKNFITCLQARDIGAPKIHLIVNNGDYENVLTNIKGSIGLDCITSPRGATLAELARYVTPDHCVELSRLGNVAKVLQFYISPNLHIVGRCMREIAWPKGTIVAALLHKYQARVPTANDKVLGGDRLIVISEETAIESLKAILQ